MSSPRRVRTFGSADARDSQLPRMATGDVFAAFKYYSIRQLVMVRCPRAPGLVMWRHTARDRLRAFRQTAGCRIGKGKCCKMCHISRY